MKKVFNFVDFITEGSKDRETIPLDDFLNDAKEVGLLGRKKDIHDDGVIRSFFYDICDPEDAEYAGRPLATGESFPYDFVEDFEQRGDGQGYETFYVFKRKSDGKTFSYYIYDGRIEEHELSECWKKKNGGWNFECKY